MQMNYNIELVKILHYTLDLDLSINTIFFFFNLGQTRKSSLVSNVDLKYQLKFYELFEVKIKVKYC